MNIHFKYIALAFGFLIALASCNKESYYHDSGRHNPKFDGTVYDFIKSRPDLFDTLLRVIDFADMQDVLKNEKITFFAPPDASIRRSMHQLNNFLYLNGRDSIHSITQVDKSIWREFLSMYIIKEPLLLKDVPQIDTNNLEAFPGQGYIT